MYLTEQDARARHCCGPRQNPHGVTPTGTVRVLCEASFCMAWRWLSRGAEGADRLGWCGIGGDPSPVYELTGGPTEIVISDDIGDLLRA